MKLDNWGLVIRRLRAGNLWLLAIVTLAFTWWACLLLIANVSSTSFALLTLYAVAVLGLLLSLSGREQRRLIALLFLGSLIIRTIEILVINTLPQHSEVNSDSTVYDLNAQALMYHWQGLKVVAEDYALPVLVYNNRDWLPADWLPYGTVFGTRHFLYQVYVGVIYFFTGAGQFTVILSHAVLLAALTPAVYCVANSLFENRRLAALAASLTLIDPNFSVAGAFLMKDALAVFLATITLWATVLVVRDRGGRYYPVVILLITLLGLSVLRYHTVVAFWLAAVLVMFLARGNARTKRLLVVLVLSFLGSAMLYYLPSSLAQDSPYSLQVVAFWLAAVLVMFLARGNARTKRLLVVLVLSFLGSAMLYYLPSSLAQDSPYSLQQGVENILRDVGSVARANQSTVQGGVETLEASSNVSSESQDDPATEGWIQSLQQNPLLAITKTVAHTLFAPYPWVPLFHGLSYNNFVELLYPGVVMWIVGLPFLFVALWRLPVRESPELLLIMLWLLLIVSAYIVFQGEFSTRQRIFMMPLFWILIAFGVEQVRAYFNKAKTTE